jgi:hypothetical protein
LVGESGDGDDGNAGGGAEERVTVQLSELRLASAVGRPPGKASTL